MAFLKYALSGMLIVLLLSPVCSLPALAHRPVIVKNRSSRETPVVVTEPEISWAFYGVLDGVPHYYKIFSEKPFELYVNILVPDLDPDGSPVALHDMSFEVHGEGAEGAPMFSAEGLRSTWRRFFEEYGRDHYYMGPEYDTTADGGTYYVRVFNGANEGRYSLAIGKREKFTFFSLIGAILKAKSLDRWFFRQGG
jgi:hypothetical protein